MVIFTVFSLFKQQHKENKMNARQRKSQLETAEVSLQAEQNKTQHNTITDVCDKSSPRYQEVAPRCAT